ncbi:hypothetical protein [Terasakiella pusilla]|uniref:hypothetical protein n=1 Tax=Terasakiella pusilla TaxID=64973 RepID=UPI00048ED91C|nr:hypothetical protein [Terasakiella pusilla]
MSKSFPWKLFVTLLATGLGIVSIAILILYNTTIATETEKLKAMAQSHARLLDAVAPYDTIYNRAFSFGESIFERIVKIANNVEGEDKQLILFSIIDSHLDRHKDSPLGEELGKATGFDLVTWHKKGLFGVPPKYKPRQKLD